MTDFAGFKYGKTRFPLSTSGGGDGGPGATLLRDCDPALFFALAFWAAVLRRHVGPRLLAEAASGGITQVSTAVADTIPLNPEPFLLERHTSFPLLAAYRKSSKFEDIGGQKHSVDDVEVVYILPPLQAGEAERLYPILKAVANCIDNRTETGMDPTYAPLGGEAGDSVWEIAGVTSAGVTGASFGAFPATEGLVFPAVVLQVEFKERSDYDLTDFGDANGLDATIDLADSIEDTVSDFIEVATYPAPTLTSISPTTGSKAGGTTVTITGTGFRTGTLPKVWIGGVAATSVHVVSATSATCVSPAHNAYDTFAADVTYEAIDGQSDSLSAAFTYTTP